MAGNEASVHTRWSEIDLRTITGNVTYAGLTALFALASSIDGFQVSVAVLSAITPTVTVYGQRTSDSKWVPLAAALSPASADAAATAVTDIARGVYSQIAYKVSSNSANGVAIAFEARFVSDEG